MRWEPKGQTSCIHWTMRIVCLGKVLYKTLSLVLKAGREEEDFTPEREKHRTVKSTTKHVHVLSQKL